VRLPNGNTLGGSHREVTNGDDLKRVTSLIGPSVDHATAVE
jgi:hypothetical protein